MEGKDYKEQVFEHLKKTCVRIMGRTEGEPNVAFGSGNAIWGYNDLVMVLTCGHNVEDFFKKNQRVWFEVSFADEEDYKPAYLISNSNMAEKEMALLVVKDNKCRKHFVDLSISDIETGTEVFMSSYFAHDNVSSTTGIISRPLVDGKTYGNQELASLVEYTAGSGEGSSGAAVVDKEGKLLAVHISSTSAMVMYDNSYEDVLFNYELRSDGCLKYGIHSESVQEMIMEMSKCMKIEKNTTFNDRLTYLIQLPATTQEKRQPVSSTPHSNIHMERKLIKLVKLPQTPNVDDIIKKYQEYRRKDDVKSTSLGGLCAYFNKALPIMLLYNEEREHYQEVITENKSPSTVYGAEHLLRLFVKLPALLYDLKIEKETLQDLQQNLHDFLEFLQKNQSVFPICLSEA